MCFEDALNYFKTGIDFKNMFVLLLSVSHLWIKEGCCESLHLLVGEIATNNALFCGTEECKIPVPKRTELGKGTYKYVGVMLAVSLVDEGPAPTSFCAIDCLVYD